MKKIVERSCEGCEYEMPKLDEESQEIFHIFMQVQTQWRSGGFGVIGLDYGVLFKIANIYGYEITPAFMRYIAACEQTALRMINEERTDSNSSFSKECSK